MKLSKANQTKKKKKKTRNNPEKNNYVHILSNASLSKASLGWGLQLCMQTQHKTDHTRSTHCTGCMVSCHDSFGLEELRPHRESPLPKLLLHQQETAQAGPGQEQGREQRVSKCFSGES